jgi:hypothetical protein
MPENVGGISKRRKGNMMVLTQSDIHSHRTALTLKVLLLAIFFAASALSIKAAYDLTQEPEIFPNWFVPSFILGVSLLIALSLYLVLRTWPMAYPSETLPSRQAGYLWGLMILSFICTTSVHGFYPFHAKVLATLPTTDSVMKINYAIGLMGFLASAALAGVYLFTPLKRPAVIGLMAVTLLLLIPNDNCANPFNTWWIGTVGASPLMYVPNMYAALFVASGLAGIHPRINGFITTGICLGSLLLGIGHQLGIIW